MFHIVTNAVTSNCPEDGVAADIEVSSNVGTTKKVFHGAKTSGNGKAEKKSIAKAVVHLELVKVKTEVVGGKVEATRDALDLVQRSEN